MSMSIRIIDSVSVATLGVIFPKRVLFYLSFIDELAGIIYKFRLTASLYFSSDRAYKRTLRHAVSDRLHGVKIRRKLFVASSCEKTLVQIYVTLVLHND